VCITTLGPGALNLTTGAAYALLGAMPMIMLTGQKGIMSSRQAKFQIVDVGQCFQASYQAFPPDRQYEQYSDDRFAMPFGIAMEERPCPVLLELPRRRGRRKQKTSRMVQQHPIEIPVAHRASLDRAAEMILKAKRPLIHARRRRVPAPEHGRHRGVRPPYANSLLHDADGEGNSSRGGNLYMGTAALSER